MVSALWSTLTNGGPFAGVTTAVLTVTGDIGLNGAVFRSVATNGGGTAVSSAATLVPLRCDPVLRCADDGSAGACNHADDDHPDHGERRRCVLARHADVQQRRRILGQHTGTARNCRTAPGVTLVAVVPLYLILLPSKSDKAPFLWS